MKKYKQETWREYLNRKHKMDKEELREYHDKVKKSHTIHRDKSKFNKSRSRQQKQRGYNYD